MSHAEITIDDLTYDVDFTYYAACRGARDSLCGKRGAGPPLEPDEPARIEVGIVSLDGKVIHPCHQLEIAIENALWEQPWI